MTESSNVELEHLMKKAQSGDASAYAELFRTITPIIKNYLFKKISDQSYVEDILQEILISIHKASNTYDTERPFLKWMFAIVYFRVNDYLRKYYKNPLKGSVDISTVSEFGIIEDVTFEDNMSEYIDVLMKDLPEKQKAVVTMMKLEGYSAEETAEKLEMSVSAVKVSAHRAYKSMAVKAKQIKEE
jgi:RNA polymerase sigma-70 factor, ECF subfamily